MRYFQISRLAEREITAYNVAIGLIEYVGCDNLIVKIPLIWQGSGDQIIMVELGGNEEDGDGVVQQSNVPSTFDLYLNSQAILSP